MTAQICRRPERRSTTLRISHVHLRQGGERPRRHDPALEQGLGIVQALAPGDPATVSKWAPITTCSALAVKHLAILWKTGSD
jgi:hypothetical protein